MESCEKIFIKYLSKKTDFKKISNEVFNNIKKGTKSPYGFVGYIDNKTQKLIIPTLTYGVWDICKMKNKRIEFSEFNNLFGWAIKNKKIVISNDTEKDKRAKGTPKGHIKIEKFLAAPSIFQGKVVGIIAVANKKDDYNNDDIILIERMASIYSVIIYNLTDEKNTEEEYKMIIELFEKSKDIIYTINENQVIDYINSAIKNYGYEKKDIIGHPPFEFAHPDDVPFLKKSVLKVLKTRQTSKGLFYRLRKKDGRYFDVEQKSGAIIENNKVRKIIGIIRDISEIKKLQDDLKQTNEILSKIFDSAKDAIYLKDFDGNYIKVNKACANIFNLKPEQMVGKNYKELFSEQDAFNIQEQEKPIREENKTIETTTERIINGKKYALNSIKIPIKYNNNMKVILVISRDITNLRKLEKQMTILKTQEKIKQSTSVFAHELNNILSIIAGYTSLIEDEILKSKNILKEIKMIRKSVYKISKVVYQFRKKTPKLIKES